MANWYSADPHFGHDNIIKYCKRPYQSAKDMDASLLSNYAGLVQPGDDLWMVGDFGFGKTASRKGYLASIFDSLPGRKHLVTGNHDSSEVLSLPWASVSNMAEISDGEQRLVLCHYPMITWNGARYGAIQLFGHVHQNWKGSRNAINVGVDVWDYKPVQLKSILSRAATLPQNSYWEVAEGMGLNVEGR